MKRPLKKLTLSAETIRTLSDLSVVRGGLADMSVHYTLCASDGCDTDECFTWDWCTNAAYHVPCTR